MTGTDLATREAELAFEIQQAKRLATADGIPKHYRNNPANIMIATRYGAAIGLTPEQSLAEIYVVDAKPSASANVIGGLVRKAGHKLRVTYNRQTKTARAVIIRKDDPDFEFVAEWDMAKAAEADLLKKDNWKHYPEAMLKRRATTEVARDACPEALHGILYTPDELDDRLPPVVTVERVEPPSAARLIEKVEVVEAHIGPDDASVTVVDTDTGEIIDVPGELVTDSDQTDDGQKRGGLDEFTRTESDAISPDQIRQIGALMKALRLTRDERLEAVNEWVERDTPIASPNELTTSEAATVIANLTQLKEQENTQ